MVGFVAVLLEVVLVNQSLPDGGSVWINVQGKLCRAGQFFQYGGIVNCFGSIFSSSKGTVAGH